MFASWWRPAAPHGPPPTHFSWIVTCSCDFCAQTSTAFAWVHPCLSCALGCPVTQPCICSVSSSHWLQEEQADRQLAQSLTETRGGETFGTAEWQVFVVGFFFLLGGMNLLSLGVVCTITGFEEAARLGGATRMGTYSSSSAKLTMRPEWTQARRQYRSAERLRNLHSYTGLLFFRTTSRVAYLPRQLIYCLIWYKIDFSTWASGWITKLSHDVSGQIPKGQGDCGRIWNSS